MKKMVTVLTRVSVVLVVPGLLGCQTFGQSTEMQEQMDAIQTNQQAMQETYAEAQSFLMALMAAGEIEKPEEFATSLVNSKEAIDSGITRLEEITAEIEALKVEMEDDLQATGDEQSARFAQERRDAVGELELFRAGFEQRVSEANEELDQIIRDTDSRFQLSLRGMQQEMVDFREAVDGRLSTTIRGLQSQQEDYETAVNNQQEDYETAVNESLRADNAELTNDIESLERELKILILGRDSVLDDVQQQVSILARSLESVSRQLLRNN